MDFEEIMKTVYKARANIMLEEYKEKCKTFKNIKDRNEYDKKCISIWKKEYRDTYSRLIQNSL